MATKSVLIVNTGSSSLKWVVLDASTEAIQDQGDAHWTGSEGGQHQRELDAVLARVPNVAAIGHRVVHGGSRFTEAVLVDDEVRRELERLATLAPLHNPAALAGMRATSAHFPGVPQVATFDTAFHATLPEHVRTYPVPWRWTSQWGVRKFGFHGLSVAYAMERVSQLLGRMPQRTVVCHLGAGCSISAVLDGRSVDTSMGFTPLEGLMMAQRSGSIDPGLVLYLLGQGDVDARTLDRELNQESGLLGVSGVSADLRLVQAAAETGNARARLAMDMFVYRIVSCVGSMLSVLHGVDVLVFTGGVGEHSAWVRAGVCAALEYAGVRLDAGANQRGPADSDISLAGSGVRTFAIQAREDLMILRQTQRLLGW